MKIWEVYFIFKNMYTELFSRICPTKLLKTPSLIWSISLFPKLKIASLMQCVESIIDVLFPNIIFNM
jgi:hypothetical protein